MTTKIKPSDLEREARLLIEAGKMPTLDQVLAAVADARKKYGPQIIAARKDRNDDAE